MCGFVCSLQGVLGQQYSGGFADMVAATVINELRDDLTYDGARFPNLLALLGALV